MRKAKDYAQRHGLDWDALPAERKLALLGTTAQHTRLEKFDGKSDRELWREHAERIGWQHTTAITDEATPALTRGQHHRPGGAVHHPPRRRGVRHGGRAEPERDPHLGGARADRQGALRDSEYIDAVVSEVEQRGITLHGEHARLIVGEMGVSRARRRPNDRPA